MFLFFLSFFERWHYNNTKEVPKSSRELWFISNNERFSQTGKTWRFGRRDRMVSWRRTSEASGTPFSHASHPMAFISPVWGPWRSVYIMQRPHRPARHSDLSERIIPHLIRRLLRRSVRGTVAASRPSVPPSALYSDPRPSYIDPRDCQQVSQHESRSVDWWGSSWSGSPLKYFECPHRRFFCQSC